MNCEFSRYFVLLALFFCPAAFSQTDLFFPVSEGPIDGSSMAAQKAAYDTDFQNFVLLNSVLLETVSPGQEVTVTAPSGEAYTIVYDYTEIGYDGGTVWVGHLSGYDKKYLTMISIYKDQVSGTIDTPDGELSVAGSQNRARLLDRKSIVDQDDAHTLDDDVIPDLREMQPKKEKSFAILEPASPTNIVEIDLMVLFDTAYANPLRTDSYTDPIADINRTVAWVNLAFRESGIYIKLNVVLAREYQPNTPSGQPAFNDPYVLELREQYGADLVTYFQRKTNELSPDVCGFAQMTDDLDDPSYGFNSWIKATCERRSTLAHEIGHNLGSQHDASTAYYGSCVLGGGGYPSYSRGYCNDNGYPTIMAYLTRECPTSGAYSDTKPRYFSNPALDMAFCKGAPCGVDKDTYFVPRGAPDCVVMGADNATAFNARAPYIAAWKMRPTRNVSIISLPFRGGVLSPGMLINTPVPFGSTVTLTVMPRTGYYAQTSKGSCKGVINGNTYTSASITKNCHEIIYFRRLGGR